MSNKIFCVDSDGCAMDTMTYKHELFFGPIASEIFEIEDTETFQKNWEDINLYSKTRGVNRFVGLVLTLQSVGYSEAANLNKWVDETTELSNRSLAKEIERTDAADLKLALEWSGKVNENISKAEGHDKPFVGALETLKELDQAGTVYVVSSANKEAVEEEWERHGLAEYVEELYCQDKGKKEDVINMLIEKDNNKEDIVMIGDSPGDLEAAKKNDVSFYPIIVGHEQESWSTLKDDLLKDMIAGTYAKDHEEDYINKFWENLN